MEPSSLESRDSAVEDVVGSGKISGLTTSKYPRLSVMAWEILGIDAMSAETPEQVFNP